MSAVQGDIGVTIGLSEAELQKGIARVNEALNSLAKSVEQLGARIDQVMAKAAGDTQKAAQATRQLTEEEKAAAATARQAAEEQKRLKEEQKKAAEAAREHEKAVAELRQGLTQVSMVAAAAAVAISAAAKAGLDAYKQQTAAFSGLRSAAEKTGESFQEAQAAAEALASDGLISVLNASKALQAYLVSGFSLEEAKELIQISKDAAVYNRQAGLSIGEAVERMADGIRMGNSVLSDAAGITKNLSQILKEQGKSEQDLQRIQSDASVRQALLNGLRAEGAIFAGNAAKAAKEYAGSEAEAANAAFRAKAAFGEALAPAVQQVMEATTSLLGKIADWIEVNPELARTIVMVTGSLTAMVAVVGSLTVLLPTLKAAFAAITGPVGLAVLGIGALAGTLVAVTTNAAAARAEMERHDQAVLDLASQYERLNRIVSSTTASEEEKKKAAEELRRVTKELGELMPEIVTQWDAEGRAIELNTQKLNENTEAIERNKRAKQSAGTADALSAAAVEYSRLVQIQAGLQSGNIQQQREALRALGGDWLGRFDALMMAADRERVLAEALQQVEREMAIKGAEVSRLSAMAAGYAHDLGAGARPLTGTGRGGTTTIDTSTTGMSPALAALMEDLADLQAMERTPENLRRQLALVRQILDEHGAELEKLGRKRDLERVANIVLPQQIADAIDKATGAEYRAALEQLEADTELLSLTPEQIRERLETIQQQFADYLKAHPDLALQLELKLKGATEAELRAPLERWQQWFRENELLGIYEGAGGLERRLQALREGQALALGAGDRSAYFQLTGQILEAERALQQANFEGRFERIGEARERAFAAVAQDLADLERQLIDAQAAGDAQLAAQIRQRMLDLVRPALEEQAKALEELLADETLTAEQRARVEAELNRVRQELYDQDVDAHRIATEAKVAAEREAAQAIEGIRNVLRQAQQEDLNRIRALQQAEEDRAQRRIEQLREELAQLERQWDAEDRRERIRELRAELAEVMADTSYQWVNPETGQVEWTYDRARARELQQRIAEAEREDERARERERLQDQINAAQERLSRMREAHREELVERQRHWDALLSLDNEHLMALVEQTDLAMGDSEDGWYGVLDKWLSQAVTTAASKTASIVSSLQSIIDKAREAQRALAGAGSSGTETSGGAVHGFAHGGVADPSNPVWGVFGERVREYLVPVDYLGELAAKLAQQLTPRLALPAVPTMPASLGASVGSTTLMVSPGAVSPGAIQINITGATDPQATAAAVRTAAKQAEQGLLEALIQAGRTNLRTS